MMPDAQNPQEDERVPEVEVLLFEIDGRRYGTDAAQVLRIGVADQDAYAIAELGALRSGNRSLTFHLGARTAGAGKSEAHAGVDQALGHLKVDAVQGVRSVRVDSLRRMPVAAGARPYTVGVWLDGDRPVLLIDLPESFNFHAAVP